jgi:hypothetical protein
MFVFPQNMNGTWRSMVGNEFPTEANTTWMKSMVDIAHKGGVEVGAYQLLLNARSATAHNQAAPHDAASLPNAGYDCMDPETKLPDHKHGKANCKGGSGCSAMCGATEFYDKMEASMHAWWKATGVSVVAQDGAESGTPCANESHTHHHGLNDSIWQQYKAVRRTFNTYLTTPMRDREGRLRQPSVGGRAMMGRRAPNTSEVASPVPTVGFIAGMPGSVMEAGEAKVPGGYSEEVFSLPRWTWIDRVRESVIASPLDRDLSTSIGRRMFPVPLSAPYHPMQLDPTKPGRWTPAAGYQNIGTLCEGSCEQHLSEMEWALYGMWGTGAFPMLRSTKLWDGPKSKALLTKAIAWAKQYRRVLSSESVTLRHGTVCWGRGPVNVSTGGPNSHGGGCTSSDLDAILHRAPKAYYGDIDERGLAMVFNPTNRTINTTLRAPLYYAGISKARGDAGAMVSQEGGAAKQMVLGVNDTIGLDVVLPPRALTWFVITEAK